MQAQTHQGRSRIAGGNVGQFVRQHEDQLGLVLQRREHPHAHPDRSGGKGEGPESAVVEEHHARRVG